MKICGYHMRLGDRQFLGHVALRFSGCLALSSGLLFSHPMPLGIWEFVHFVGGRDF